MAKYELILWDVDGTLMNFERAQAESLGNAFRKVGLPFTPETLSTYIEISYGLWEAFERGEITKEHLQMERFQETQIAVFGEERVDAATLNNSYVDFLSLCVFPEEGAEEILGALKGHCEMAIITNGIQRVQESRYEGSFLKEYIKRENLFVSEGVGWQKPSQQYFDIVFERLGMENRRQDALVVGDSLTADILGGQNAGTATCWYNPQGLPKTTEVRVDFEIRHLGEVEKIVL